MLYKLAMMNLSVGSIISFCTNYLKGKACINTTKVAICVCVCLSSNVNFSSEFQVIE
jgi:hypothetical protein